MKENSGRLRRHRLMFKLGTVLLIFVVSMGLLIWANNPRTPHSSDDYNPNGNKLKSTYERILSAEWHLIDLAVGSKGSLRKAPTDSYDGIVGTFCVLDFSIHKADPSSVPMFRDLVSKSPRCKKTTQKVFLKDIATMARQMDRDNQRQPTSLQVPKPLNISGVVFHESRCGSTLVANSLIGMNPTQHRVYSESPPPVTAMRICGEDYSLCSKQQAAAILRDTLYMMSRTNDPKEQRVFFKIQSVGSRHIEVFREAFPDTPWIFVYREPVQVMMSHLKYGIRRANCLRSHHNPPPVTQNLIKRHGRDNTAQLSPQEFCAAHLATITESAMENLRQTNYGVPVNYASLPAILYETILPHHMGIPTTATEIHNILQVSSQYSKGRDDKKAEWQEDSTEKEKAASREIRQAAKEFMTESFAALEEFGGAKLKTLQA